uniref:Uncharacterized protein n=1 Tax=Anguilla anguilla TaxID=7936 RepID=A0A0E9WZW7_ANGAN
MYSHMILPAHAQFGVAWSFGSIYLMLQSKGHWMVIHSLRLACLNISTVCSLLYCSPARSLSLSLLSLALSLSLSSSTKTCPCFDDGFLKTHIMGHTHRTPVWRFKRV